LCKFFFLVGSCYFILLGSNRVSQMSLLGLPGLNVSLRWQCQGVATNVQPFSVLSIQPHAVSKLLWQTPQRPVQKRLIIGRKQLECTCFSTAKIPTPAGQGTAFWWPTKHAQRQCSRSQEIAPTLAAAALTLITLERTGACSRETVT